METNQQQPTPAVVQPSLADLDKKVEPVVTPPVVTPPVNPNPVIPPVVDPNKPVVPPVVEPEKKEPEETGEDTEDDDPEDPMAFYGEVSKLRGDGYEFKFPEGVEPNSPEGLHHAMTQLVDYELDQLEQNMMKQDARAYAYMLHRANGGNDEDFFSVKTEPLPEWDVLKGSVDLQQSFYRRVLGRKEIAPEEADLIIKNAIDKNKLGALVETEYNRMKKQDEDQARQLLARSEQNQKLQEQIINKMGATLQEKIIENKGLGITIPDAKRGEFLQFVNQLVHLDTHTGQWYLQQALTQENMNTVLEALYYQSVGGNMDDIISKRAQANNVKQLKLNMGKDKKKTATVQNPNQSTKPGVQPTLSSI